MTRRSRRHRTTAVVAGALVVALGACGGSNATARPRPGTAASTPTSTTAASVGGPANPCGAATTVPATYEHVIWVWMENHTASDVIGNPDAAYTTTLARGCGSAARYASVGSPSLPNYIGATSGSAQGIHDDDAPSSHPLTVDNLFRQVRQAGKVERSYEESMTGNCELASSGLYAVKHNPAAYYVGGQDRAACQRDDVPLGNLGVGALRQDLDRGSLPAFSFVTPNLCSDTHDCPVRSGDAWLQQWMPIILASSAYRQGHTAVFVVWDEPTPMPLVVVSPTTPPGAVEAAPVDHYALLRTAEELLGLPFLPGAATAPSLRGALRL